MGFSLVIKVVLVALFFLAPRALHGMCVGQGAGPTMATTVGAFVGFTCPSNLVNVFQFNGTVYCCPQGYRLDLTASPTCYSCTGNYDGGSQECCPGNTFYQSNGGCCPSGTSFVSGKGCCPQDCSGSGNTDSSDSCDASGSTDPHFKGFQGERFSVNGEPNTWFNILSSPDLQLNAYFERSCEDTWFFFMGQIAIKASGHMLYFNHTSAEVDNVLLPCCTGWTPILLGLDGVDGRLLHQWINHFHLNTSDFDVILERHIVDPTIQKPTMDFYGKNCIGSYFNFDIRRLKLYPYPHGLVGQTANHKHTAENTLASKGHQGEGEIEGTYKDYIVSGPFADDFKFNQYTFKLKAN